MYSSEICPCCVFITWALGGVGGGGRRGAWPPSALHSSSEKIFRCPPLMACGWAFFSLACISVFLEINDLIFYSQWFFPPAFFSASKEPLYKDGTGEEGGIPHVGFWAGKLSRHRPIIRAVVIWGPNMALSSRKEIFSNVNPDSTYL